MTRDEVEGKEEKPVATDNCDDTRCEHWNKGCEEHCGAETLEQMCGHSCLEEK